MGRGKNSISNLNSKEILFNSRFGPSSKIEEYNLPVFKTARSLYGDYIPEPTYIDLVQLHQLMMQITELNSNTDDGGYPGGYPYSNQDIEDLQTMRKILTEITRTNAQELSPTVVQQLDDILKDNSLIAKFRDNDFGRLLRPFILPGREGWFDEHDDKDSWNRYASYSSVELHPGIIVLNNKKFRFGLINEIHRAYYDYATGFYRNIEEMELHINCVHTVETFEQEYPDYQADLNELVKAGYFKPLKNPRRVRPSEMTDKFLFVMKYAGTKLCIDD